MTVDLTDSQLDALLKRLHLANTRRARLARGLVLRAKREEWSCRDFLALHVSEEIAQCQQTRIACMGARCALSVSKQVGAVRQPERRGGGRRDPNPGCSEAVSASKALAPPSRRFHRSTH